MCSEQFKLTQEELEWEKQKEKWLEEHQFTKKWNEVCPPVPLGKNPLYEKPKPAETINENEISIEEDMPKRIKIEKGPYLEAYENSIKKNVEESIKAKYGNVKPGDFVHKQVPVGSEFNDIEVIKPQTDLDEYEDARNILKEYQKDVAESRIKKRLSENVLTPEEEEELKEKFVQEKTDEIMKGIEDLSKTYVPGENVDRTKRINDMDFIRTVAKVFGLDKYFVPVEPIKQEEKKAYVKPELNIDDGIVGFDEEKKPLSKTFDTICLEIMDLHAKKNKDYGNAAHQSYKEFGITSYIIRLNDKLNRLKTLTKSGSTMEIKDESIIDTLKDLAAYSIMAIESMLDE